MKRPTDYRVSINGSGWYLLPTEKAAQTFGGVRSMRVIQRIEPDGSWREIHKGPDPKPKREDEHDRG